MASLALPIISGIGSLFSGLFGGSAASKASQQYIQGLQQAQNQLQDTETQGLQQYSPYLSEGSTSTYALNQLLGKPGQGLLAPWDQTFTAPTAEQAQQTPGYQFQLKAGQDAIQNSAAGQGSLLSGRTLADLNNYAQGVASTNYQNMFNNSLTQYQQAYNSFLNNQNNTYQRLLGGSSLGLGAAQGATNLISGIGQDIASLYGQQGAARAQGTIGAANAYGSIFSGLGNNLTNYFLLKNLGGFGGGTNSGGWTPPSGPFGMGG